MEIFNVVNIFWFVAALLLATLLSFFMIVGVITVLQFISNHGFQVIINYFAILFGG